MKAYHSENLWQNFYECQYLSTYTFKQIKCLDPFEKLSSVTGNVIAAYRWFGWVCESVYRCDPMAVRAKFSKGLLKAFKRFRYPYP